jgi:hypothetical protein
MECEFYGIGMKFVLGLYILDLPNSIGRQKLITFLFYLKKNKNKLGEVYEKWLSPNTDN